MGLGNTTPYGKNTITYGCYANDDVLPCIGDRGGGVREFCTEGGIYKVSVSGHRLQCFKRSQSCVSCGIVGNVWALQGQRKEGHPTAPTLFLYHRSEGGTLTLLTVDHRIPKVRGGSNALENLNTMCAPCNNTKGELTDVEFDAIMAVRKGQTFQTTKTMYSIWDIDGDAPKLICYCASEEMAHYMRDLVEERIPGAVIVAGLKI